MTPAGFAATNPDLTGRSVLVIGLGRSGRAAARLAASRSARVTCADSREQLPREALDLENEGIRVLAGGHPVELLEQTGAELLVVSPGVPLNIDLIQAAKERGLPVWGEIELAARFTCGRIIGITGSNGKSTVTTMIGNILRTAGIPGGTGGNLEVPLAELLEQDSEAAVHAVELSSFQLESVEALDPEVAVVVNLTPDHLDRYASFDDYGRAKARLLEVQSSARFSILNADDPESQRFLSSVQGRLHLFSLESSVAAGAFVRDGMIILRTGYGEEAILEAERLPLPGPHNLANGLAAALACRLAGCDIASIAQGLLSYRPLAHRLQKVDTVDGIDFYNDSKATNLDAVVQAIRSFRTGSVHLILGGKDKGGEWSSLLPLLQERVRSVLLVGQAAGVISRTLGSSVAHRECVTVQAAVQAGFEDARAGEVVLLSPGCASFDQYTGFEARGDDFIAAVNGLHRHGGNHA
ncbi:MAG: UDP-N-acetylmuramoyl-L-alanine--D-glutamate ligase [Acidobacteria bacterium]|uniref:UDP-N-acetylmuramoylalanine--D-glutamate ligase n=1 Tax=Candidatus Polarisedimenticola svalbardensis TaxID=2886004 RepID=A0A8J7C1L4_9BACT|nr:UDP-N-acetylmuramoyl-L-alanine--D-glutamate ligase [Candidatus Polarisedimenticola svalbardensis]